MRTGTSSALVAVVVAVVFVGAAEGSFCRAAGDCTCQGTDACTCQAAGNCYCGQAQACTCQKPGDCYCQDAETCSSTSTGTTYCGNAVTCNGQRTDGSGGKKDDKNCTVSATGKNSCDDDKDSGSWGNLQYAALIIAIIGLAFEVLIYVAFTLKDKSTRSSCPAQRGELPPSTCLSERQRRRVLQHMPPGQGEDMVWADTPVFWRVHLRLFIIMTVVIVLMVVMNFVMFVSFNKPLFRENAKYLGSLLAFIYSFTISLLLLINISDLLFNHPVYAMSNCRVLVLEKACGCCSRTRSYDIGCLPFLELRLSSGTVGSVIFDKYHTVSTDSHGHTSTSTHYIGFKDIPNAQAVCEHIRLLGGSSSANVGLLVGASGVAGPSGSAFVTPTGQVCDLTDTRAHLITAAQVMVAPGVVGVPGGGAVMAPGVVMGAPMQQPQPQPQVVQSDMQQPAQPAMQQPQAAPVVQHPAMAQAAVMQQQHQQQMAAMQMQHQQQMAMMQQQAAAQQAAAQVAQPVAPTAPPAPTAPEVEMASMDKEGKGASEEVEVEKQPEPVQASEPTGAKEGKEDKTTLL